MAQLVGKESTCNVGDLGLIPGLGRSPREGKGYSLQYSGLENSMDYIFLGLYSMGHKESDTTERLSLHFIQKYCLFIKGCGRREVPLLPPLLASSSH